MLEVASDATPQQVEAAYLEQLVRIKGAYLQLGGFEQQSVPSHHSFEAFAAGDCNCTALDACRKACAAPGHHFNPLFIYGKCGVGKTHLLGAMAACLRSRWPQSQVVLMSADALTDELVNAIADQSARRFREKYRNLDALLIDSVQLWNNRGRVQEEILKIVDHLVASRKQVVFASTCPAKDLGGVMPGLASRYSSSLQVEVEEPSLEGRRAILKTMSHRLGLELPRDVEFILAQRVHSDARALEGAIRKLLAHQSVDTPYTPRRVEEVLFDLVPPAPVAALSVDEVLETVTQHFGLDPADVCTSRGTQKIKRARQIGIYLSRNLTDACNAEIGRKFKATDNQVLYAVRTVTRNVVEDPVTKRDVETLRKRLQRPQKPAAPPSEPKGRRNGRQ